MCGFVGVMRGPGRGVRREEFAPLVPSVARRGPDGTGIFVDGEFGLVATRLAIQGGREGDQPLLSPDGRFVLAYNGELFASHRRRLRGALRAEGAGEVRAVSDSALLLAWLAHRLGDRRAGGPIDASAFEVLSGGMYAFAIADLATREVFLHTDGAIKPLYVAASLARGEVWFASTPATLWLAMGGPRRLDTAEWAYRLVAPDGRRPLLSTATAIEEVRDRVLVASASEAGRVRVAVRVAAARSPSPLDAIPPELDDVREAFEEAAREAAETSGPISIFLSGGIDSAAVAAWCGRKDALALTGRFEPLGGPFDESADAASVASAAGLRHESVTLSDADLLDDLSDVVTALEDPCGGPGSLAIHRLAHRARAHGRVALSGTGGDERFAGYTRIALALRRHGSWTAGYEALGARMDRAGTDPRRRWMAAVDRSGDLLAFLDPGFAATLPVAAQAELAFEAAFPAADGGEAPSPARAMVEAEIATTLRMLLARRRSRDDGARPREPAGCVPRPDPPRGGRTARRRAGRRRRRGQARAARGARGTHPRDGPHPAREARLPDAVPSRRDGRRPCDGARDPRRPPVPRARLVGRSGLPPPARRGASGSRPRAVLDPHARDVRPPVPRR